MREVLFQEVMERVDGHCAVAERVRFPPAAHGGKQEEVVRVQVEGEAGEVGRKKPEGREGARVLQLDRLDDVREAPFIMRRRRSSSSAESHGRRRLTCCSFLRAEKVDLMVVGAWFRRKR